MRYEAHSLKSSAFPSLRSWSETSILLPGGRRIIARRTWWPQTILSCLELISEHATVYISTTLLRRLQLFAFTINLSLNCILFFFFLALLNVIYYHLVRMGNSNAVRDLLHPPASMKWLICSNMRHMQNNAQITEVDPSALFPLVSGYSAPVIMNVP